MHESPASRILTEQSQVSDPRVVPCTAAHASSHIGQIQVWIWWIFSLVAGVVAVGAGSDHIAGHVPSAVTLSDEVLCRALKARCTASRDAGKLNRGPMPHLDTAIPAAAMLLLKGLKAK